MTRLNYWDALTVLRDEPNAQRRGTRLEPLIAEAFRAHDFGVTLNAGAARPRQTDFFASLGSERYLVEVKWTNRKIGVDAVDALRSRLNRTPSHVIGVLVSMAGFTRSAIDEVVAGRARPIVLLVDNEIQDILGGWLDVRDLLRTKTQRLITHGEVDLGSTDHVARGPAASRLSSGESPAFAVIAGDPSMRDVVRCGGGFDPLVYAQDLPDIDWTVASGFGVTLDLRPDPSDALGVVAIVERLAELRRTTDEARWSIRQAHTNWHGFGSAAFVRALEDWRERYASIDNAHHTEEYTYFDHAPGGFYTLSGDVSVRNDRRSSSCNLSFQLAGVPLDLDPLRDLALAIGASRYAEFRPRGEKSVGAVRLFGDDEVPLAVKGFIVAHGRIDPEEWWVTGVIAENPFRRTGGAEGISPPEGWPAEHFEVETLLCDLRSQHEIDSPAAEYRLIGWEYTWTSDVLVFRPRADW